jgi:hypothetical protein
VETSRELHLRILEDAEFRRGAIDIHWLERRVASLLDARPPEAVAVAASVASALLARTDGGVHPAGGSGAVGGADQGGPGGGGDGRTLAASPRASWAAVARREALRE